MWHSSLATMKRVKELSISKHDCDQSTLRYCSTVSLSMITVNDIPQITSFVPEQQELRPLESPKWLGLFEAKFQDEKGTTRSWEVCNRIHKQEQLSRSNDVDAVDIIAILPSRRILLVLQYRPPVQSWTLEFPSGLIDPNESPATAALRELKEETGLTGVVSRISSPITYEPGITGSCSRMVWVDVQNHDGWEENVHKEEDEWSLRPVLLELTRLADVLEDLVAQCSNLKIDSRLYSFAAGLDAAHKV
ncbi:NUDIX hydrolase domain-like protein [Gaertneriomyces semiglobifer]|nr:NUDIX hydrolase domain-like protein [Gaertneriomyces semiglobifer]